MKFPTLKHRRLEQAQWHHLRKSSIWRTTSTVLSFLEINSWPWLRFKGHLEKVVIVSTILFLFLFHHLPRYTDFLSFKLSLSERWKSWTKIRLTRCNSFDCRSLTRCSLMYVLVECCRLGRSCTKWFVLFASFVDHAEFHSLQGVEVKIGEKFRPPKKVSLINSTYNTISDGLILLNVFRFFLLETSLSLATSMMSLCVSAVNVHTVALRNLSGGIP